MKPFAQAPENNKAAILEVLREEFANTRQVLEIGSGTGQHAVYFGDRLAPVIWLTSDLAVNHEGILAWLEEAGLANVRPPLTLDVEASVWPIESVDAVFTANTLHIMSWHSVTCLFEGLGRVLQEHGLFAVYGPFNFNAEYTTDSNRRFDHMLRAGDPASGVRNFEDLDQLASAQGLVFEHDHAMPANNRILTWRKSASMPRG